MKEFKTCSKAWKAIRSGAIAAKEKIKYISFTGKEVVAVYSGINVLGNEYLNEIK